MASAAAPLTQLGRADTGMTGADPLVERREILADGDHRGRPAAADGVTLRRKLAHRRVPGGDRRGQPGGKVLLVPFQDRDVLAKGLGPLHDLELDVFQLGLAARQRGQLVLQRLEILGGAGSGVEAGAVAGGAVADQLDVGLGLLDLTLDVGQGGARVDQLGVERPRLVLQRRDLAVLGQVRRRVGDLVEPHVDGLEVEQCELTGRVGVQQNSFSPGRSRRWRPRRRSRVPCAGSR